MVPLQSCNHNNNSRCHTLPPHPHHHSPFLPRVYFSTSDSPFVHAIRRLPHLSSEPTTRNSSSNVLCNDIVVVRQFVMEWGLVLFVLTGLKEEDQHRPVLCISLQGTGGTNRTILRWGRMLQINVRSSVFGPLLFPQDNRQEDYVPLYGVANHPF